MLWRIAGAVPFSGDPGLQNISDPLYAVFTNCMNSHSELFP